MIKHLVLLHWNESADDKSIAKVIAAFDAIPGEVPQIRRCEHGSDAGFFKGNADYAVIMDFETEEDLKAYVFHPAHQRLLDEVTGPILASFSCTQIRLD